MSNQILRLLTVLVISIIFQGCATKSKDIDTGLYLRSEFTWWEANPSFKFKMTDMDTMVLSTNVIPDGKAYHLKIADKGWSKTKNCGPEKMANGKLLLGQWVEMTCVYDEKLNKVTPLENAFIFTPPKAGIYRFTLQHKTMIPTLLKVELITEN